MLPTAPKLTDSKLLQLIEEARNAELCRDTESLRRILQGIWIIEEMPNFDNYEEAIKAELLRLAGVFLSFYGIARNKKNYQLRGKDLLTNAVEIFEARKLLDKAAEVKINLAFCYWNLGEVNECEAILEIVENDFGKNLLHPVYLQLCINRMLIYFWSQNIKPALKIIEEIAVPMQFCDDVRLQAMFNTQAGIFYRASEKYDKAVFHLNEAIRVAKRANNQLYVAMNLNNLAYLYKEKEDFQTALDNVSESINKFNEIRHQGFLPHALDTKALIYLDWNKIESALETINESIECFKQGEDYRGLTDALWTKVRCLFRLECAEEALLTFTDLKDIASAHIGEIAVKKFAKKFIEEIYILRHLPLSEELTAFKKARIGAALIETNGAISKAAKILGYNNHQALSEILNNQFPELLGELGFKRRARRGSTKKKIIARLTAAGKRFAFDFRMPSNIFEAYYFDKNSMKIFGIRSAAVVAVIPMPKPSKGKFALIADNDRLTVGKIEYDDLTKIHFISDAQSNPIPIDEVNIVGEPVGFCLSKADEKYIRFSRLS